MFLQNAWAALTSPEITSRTIVEVLAVAMTSASALLTICYQRLQVAARVLRLIGNGTAWSFTRAIIPVTTWATGPMK